MKRTLYLYILESMADWEVGYILGALSMESMLKDGRNDFTVKTLSKTKDPIKTIGGLTLIPDVTLDQVHKSNMAALLLPGSEKWNTYNHSGIIELVNHSLDNGILVAAICGATLSLANAGILDLYKHTSNSKDYLKLFSDAYNGDDLYSNSMAVTDKNLITAGSAGGLMWTKHILRYLKVYPEKVIESWYNYFLTGNPKYYNELISY